MIMLLCMVYRADRTFPTFTSPLCEMAYSNMEPEHSDAIKAKNLFFSDVTLGENEAILLFSCLFNRYWPVYCVMMKNGDNVWPKCAEYLTT